MSAGDGLALLLYATAALLTLSLARRLHARGLDGALTRKLVHVTAGLSPLIITAVADHRWAGLLPYALTTLLTFILYRRGGLPAIQGQRGDPGIVTLPLAQLLLLALLWHPPAVDRRLAVALAAITTVAVGDALAALVGRRYGRHPYRVGGQTRTWEGSGTMFASSLLVVATLLTLFGAPAGAALPAAALATIVEAVAPGGMDNLLVPAAVALVLLGVG